MRLIKIQSEENGAHQYQTISVNIPVPDGWALVPENMELENCPFGEVTARKINGVKTVTKWVAGTIPESEEPPEPEPVTTKITDNEPVTWAELDNAYNEGVNGAYEQ